VSYAVFVTLCVRYDILCPFHESFPLFKDSFRSQNLEQGICQGTRGSGPGRIGGTLFRFTITVCSYENHCSCCLSLQVYSNIADMCLRIQHHCVPVSISINENLPPTLVAMSENYRVPIVPISVNENFQSTSL